MYNLLIIILLGEKWGYWLILAVSGIGGYLIIATLLGGIVDYGWIHITVLGEICELCVNLIIMSLGHVDILCCWSASFFVFWDWL